MRPKKEREKGQGKIQAKAQEIHQGQKYKRQSGSTFIEILISLLITSVTLVSVSNMLTDSIAALSNHAQQQQAVRLASSISEILSSIPATLRHDLTSHFMQEISNTVGMDCDQSLICAPTEWLSSQLSLSQREIEQHLSGGRLELVDVDTDTYAIQITWKQRNGAQHLYTLQQTLPSP
jgi:Tfp pilus assembly protein PilV